MPTRESEHDREILANEDEMPLAEDLLESEDDYEALAIKRTEVPKGPIHGHWHKTRLRFAFVLPLLFLIMFSMLFTSVMALFLALHGVHLEHAIVWDLIIPLAGGLAAAVGLAFAWAAWPATQRTGPFQPFAAGMVAVVVVHVLTFTALAFTDIGPV